MPPRKSLLPKQQKEDVADDSVSEDAAISENETGTQSSSVRSRRRTTMAPSTPARHDDAAMETPRSTRSLRKRRGSDASQASSSVEAESGAGTGLSQDVSDTPARRSRRIALKRDREETDEDSAGTGAPLGASASAAKGTDKKRRVRSQKHAENGEEETEGSVAGDDGESQTQVDKLLFGDDDKEPHKEITLESIDDSKAPEPPAPAAKRSRIDAGAEVHWWCSIM
eukprot:ANDGO_05241.mRNA.1 hypothetical protein